MRDSFIFYRSFYNAAKTLGKEGRLKLYDSIMELSFNHDENDTDLTRICDEIEADLKHKRFVLAQFLLIKPQLKANHRKYLNGCKEKTKWKQNRSEVQANVNENVNENVNVNDNERAYSMPRRSSQAHWKKNNFSSSLSKEEEDAAMRAIRSWGVEK